MNQKSIFAALLLLEIFSGCVSPPVQSGFLSTYQGLTKQFDLDGVRVTPGANLSSYDTLVIAPVDLKRTGQSLSSDDLKNIVELLEKNFRVEMSKYFKSVISGTEAPSDRKVLKLEIALTEVQPTDVAKNLVIGFGVGNATGSIEGRFMDAATGAELIAFTDRKKGSPFTKKEYEAGMKFPNWSKLRYLYIFTEIWAENAGNIVKAAFR